jgi:two-component system NarL family response regulator
MPARGKIETGQKMSANAVQAVVRFVKARKGYIPVGNYGQHSSLVGAERPTQVACTADLSILPASIPPRAVVAVDPAIRFGDENRPPQDELGTAGREKAGGLRSVIVVEEDPNARFYFREIVQSTDDFNLAGEFATVDEVLSRVSCLRPNLMLLGLRLPDRNGIECIRRLKRTLTALKIIIVTDMANSDALELALEAGAETCLVKPVSVAQCVATLRVWARRQIEIERKPRLNGPEFVSGVAWGRKVSLSQREHEVMGGLAEGLLYKEISDKLGISYSAVHKHQHRLFVKLHVTNRSEAIRVWWRAGFSNGFNFVSKQKEDRRGTACAKHPVLRLDAG